MRCSIEEVVALRAATLEDGLIVPPKWFVTTENTELHVKVRTRPVEKMAEFRNHLAPPRSTIALLPLAACCVGYEHTFALIQI